MRKRLISLLLSAVLSTGLCIPAYADPLPTADYNIYIEETQSEYTPFTPDAASKILDMVDITLTMWENVLDSFDGLDYYSGNEAYYNVMLAQDLRLQFISKYYDTLLTMMEPYAELKTASLLLQLAKEALPSKIESPTEETVNAWLRSQTTAVELLVDSVEMIYDIINLYGY